MNIDFLYLGLVAAMSAVLIGIKIADEVITRRNKKKIWRSEYEQDF